MNMNNFIQCALYMGVLVLLANPLGAYMARVYDGKSVWADKILGPFERLIYRFSGVSTEEMNWKTYAIAMMLFNAVGFAVVYFLQRVQHHLPFNPLSMSPVSADSSFNTAISFVRTTHWQGYGC